MSAVTQEDSLYQVVTGGYCIGCGACAVADSAINIEENLNGIYQSNIIAREKDETYRVCPFSSDLDEDDIGRKLYEDGGNYDKHIGYYKSVYTGHVNDGKLREAGSSGGLATWVLSELFDRGAIDGVIHVGETNEPGNLFEYRVSETKNDIIANAKSRYYPVHMDEVLNNIRGNGKKYAFVGVPCFVKAVRLLAEHDRTIAESIKYCISIFCGHFKTKSFAEMIALQQGVKPEELAKINFRVKYSDRPAYQYGMQITQIDNEKFYDLPPMQKKDVYGMDWGLGYFKPRACDWCDDIAGETADLACGDAWLPEFSSDPGGTNIAVVRHADIANLVKEGIRTGRLELSEQPAEKVYQSQAGNYRHRHEGLAVRISDVDASGEWHPPKRISPRDFTVSNKRIKIYRFRETLARKSHESFRKAKEKDSFESFYLRMFFYEIKYYLLTDNFIKGVGRSTLSILHYYWRKFL